MRKRLLLMFFLSGFCALVYQVVWVRMLGLVFGVTSLALSTVLSAFMAGLALGSYFGGRFIERRRDHLRVFGALQIGIGLFALLFPLLVAGMTALFVSVYRQWPAHFYVFSLMRFALAFGILLVPTTLMGATLPVIARCYVKGMPELGRDVAALYSANNCGAVLGALAAGFVMIHALGMREASFVAAALSLAMGAIAWHMNGRREGGRDSPGPASQQPQPNAETEEPAAETPTYPRHVVAVVLVVFAIEGFTSLAYEVVWTRMLASSFVVVTVYTYSLVIATFIAGLAIGSFLVRRFVDSKRDLLSILGCIEIAIALCAVLLLPLFQASDVPDRLAGGDATWATATLATAAWLGALMLVPTTLMGATFPLVSRIYAVNFRELGRRIGKIGFLDTAGSIFGAFAGGMVLVPLLGTQGSVLLLAAMNAVIGLAVLLVHPALRLRSKAAVAAFVGAGALCACVLLPRRVMFLRPYLQRSDIARRDGFVILDYEEDTGGTVVVAKFLPENEKLLIVNGADVAGSGRILQTTQVVQAHLPLLLYESLNGRRARRALTIGLGTGSTSYSLSLHDLETIDCVELVPGILRAAREHFQELNHNVFEDPRYRVILQDARTHVMATEQKYDVILDDSVHPGYEGNANLYSRDFFRHCRDRLTEDGVMSAWVPVFMLSTQDLQTISRSFQEVFPHASMWCARNGWNKHLVLVGTMKPLQIDFERFSEAVTRPKVQADLAQVDLGDPCFLLNALVLGEDDLRRYARSAPLHTDNHPRLAFTAARNLREFRMRAAWSQTLRNVLQQVSDISSHVRSYGETADATRANRECVEREARVVAHLDNGFYFGAIGRYSDAIRKGQAALEINPGNRSAHLLLAEARCGLASRLIAAGDLSAARQQCEEAARLLPDYFWAHAILAGIYAREGRLERAVQVGERARQLRPDDLSWRYSMAMLYEQAGLRRRAAEELRYVAQRVPNSAQAVEALARLRDRVALKPGS